jgi:preprotein translocase subunit SecA
MNIQREAIYRKRNNALTGERLNVDLNNMFESLIEAIAFDAKRSGSFGLFRRTSLEILGFDPEVTAAEFNQHNANQLGEKILGQFQDFYHRKMNGLTKVLMDQVAHINETHPGRYKRILLPFSDGSAHPLPISADIEKATTTEGKSIVSDIEQAVTLSIIDDKWKEHLRNMDELKTSTYAASFEQKDPLVVYKIEAFNLFETLVMDNNEETTAYLAKGGLVFPENKEPQLRQAPKEKKQDLSKLSTNRAAAEQQAARAAGENVSKRQKVETFVRQEKKIKRNDPCPCGSGKKYKACHGK